MDKERVVQIIREALVFDGRAVFAYVYGSFVREDSFRDVDVAIFVRNPEEDPFVVSSDIKALLSRRVRKEAPDLDADRFDIQIINHAPFTFLRRVFQEGKLLIDGDPELRTDLIEYVSIKYRECAGLLAEVSLK